MISATSLSVSPCPSVPVRAASPLQPVADIAAYLHARQPVPHYTQEESLFASLPTSIKSDLRILLGTRPSGGAFGQISHLVNEGLSVTQAVASARSLFRVPGSCKRLRARYDAWQKSRDWVALVNRSKAGADWQDRDDGLPQAFLEFCAKRFGAYKRADAKRQALLAIKRQWITGRNADGQREPIPGYGYRDTSSASHSSYPAGWSYSNILRQIRAANLFPTAVRLLLHQSTAAARSVLPGVRFDRSVLRFLELVEFDDVKCDFLIVDPESHQVCDLWLLVARDRATAILLGFGMRPARAREDGSQEHLRLRDMKQLCGWLLERYGLPPYEVTYKVEHGTATLSEGSRAVLRELLPGRIDVSFSSMLGGASPSGYAQRAIGNSKGKASLESHNRLMHTMLADRPGQTGPLYTVRPADLQARAKEAAAILETTAHLPEHLRRKVGYPVLTITQAREHLHRCFDLQNNRTEHDLQGFDEVVEIWDPTRNLWVPQSSASVPSVPSALCVSASLREDHQSHPPVRTRKESPLERCARLVAPYQHEWTSVSPEIIRAFYEHTARTVVVKDSGLIEFRADGQLIEFMPAPGAAPQIPGTKLLAYFHPDDPAFLHLTDGQGRVVGTWLRRSRATDTASIQTAIRYGASALKAAKEISANYAADDRANLDSMRAANADLLASSTFEPVAIVPAAPPTAQAASPVAHALVRSRAEVKAAEKQRRLDSRDARDLLRKAADNF